MTSFSAVKRFRETFEGATLGQGKICNVGIGRVQGLQPNLDACRDSAEKEETLPQTKAGTSSKAPATESYTKAKPASDIKTTLMLRNIPNVYTRSMLLELLEQKGLLPYIDFFYVPIDFRYRRNVGYCFVNGVSEEAALYVRQALDGTKFESVGGYKTCEIVLAQVQGLQANIEAYRNSAVMYMPDKFHPMWFQNGLHRPFPPPTLTRKQLRELKSKKKGVSKRVLSPNESAMYTQLSQQPQANAVGIISLHDGLDLY